MPSVYCFLPLVILTLPLKWIFAAALSVALHEGAHIVTLLLFRRRIYRVELRFGGLRLETEALTAWQELVSALAGPASCLLVLPLAKWLPRTAVCSALHALYNLLPVYPLDGGRALSCLMELCLPNGISGKVFRGIQAVAMVGLAVAGVYGSAALHLGPLPVLFAALLIGKAALEKNLAKRSRARYNSRTKEIGVRL